ncbi:MAG: head decoration protein, partial [Steroidobacteraceae bacterium]
GFTITAGGTAFVPGDIFTVTVAAGSLKWVTFDPTGADGREVAAGILWSGYKDATSADQKAVAVVRGPCRVNSTELVWGAGVATTPQKTAALLTLKGLGIQAT